MKNINRKNITSLIKGASLFTCGGGLSFTKQLEDIKCMKNLSVNLKSLSAFNPKSYLFTVAEIGTTQAPPIEKEKIAQKMLGLLEKNVGVPLTGIYPVEIGQESITVKTAEYVGLPIADIDSTGFRAVPFVDISVFLLKKIPISYETMIIATSDGKIQVIKGIHDSKDAEEKLRTIANQDSNGIIVSIGEIVSVGMLQKHFQNTRSYSQALQFGKIKSIDMLVKKLSPKYFLEGKILKTKMIKTAGFFSEYKTFQEKSGEIFTLVCLNETLYILNSKRKIFACVPGKILLIDKENIVGLSNQELVRDREVMILIIPAADIWTTPQAKKMFGGKRFSYLLSKRKIKV